MAMHNGDKFEPVTADFVRRTEWSTSIETPFKLTYTNGKVIKCYYANFIVKKKMIVNYLLN